MSIFRKTAFPNKEIIKGIRCLSFSNLEPESRMHYISINLVYEIKTIISV
ncbi:MAG: hypothetical protein QM731_04505 [Chitinophagaceae bacterium]